MQAAFECEVIKVAGTPAENFWSQNFAEIPTDSEKLALRGQLFLVITVKSAHNPAELGHKLWISLTSAFYSNLTGGVLAALGEAANSTLTKFSAEESFDELDFVAASLWGKILYLVQAGKAAAGLVRDGKFSQVLQSTYEKPAKITSASGFLKDSDLIFLATTAFFEEFANLEKFWQVKTADIEEELDAKVIQNQRTSQIAVQVLKIKEAAVPSSEEVVTFAQNNGGKIFLLKSQVSAKIFWFLQQEIWKYWVRFLSKISKILPKREIYLSVKPGLLLRKKFFSLALSILVLIFVISLGLGIWQKQRRINFEKFGEYYSLAQTLFEEAEAISGLNRLRSRELLDQASENLEQAKKLKFEKGKVAELEEKINQANLKSLKLVKIDNPGLVFDLSLVKVNAVISEVEKPETILVFDRPNTTLFSVSLETKTGQIAGGGGEFDSFSNFTATNNAAFFLKLGEGIYQFDRNTKAVKKIINQDPNWGQILDLTSFAGNLYLLDGKAGQIWKYIPTGDGFSSIRGFLTQPGKLDFSGASLAIDGFIWVLTGQGKLYKISPQEVLAVEISGLDRSLSSKTILRTNLDAENLYIGDLGNSRILVLSKTGLYLAQYSSGFFANMSDFVVDELGGKIYFAQGSKIFQFDLVK